MEQQVRQGRFDALSISRLKVLSHVRVAAQYHGLDPRLAKRGEETRLVQSTIQELTHNVVYTAHLRCASGATSREDLLFNGIALDGHVALDESPVRLMGKTSKANALATGEVKVEGQTQLPGDGGLDQGRLSRRGAQLLRAVQKGTRLEAGCSIDGCGGWGEPCRVCPTISPHGKTGLSG